MELDELKIIILQKADKGNTAVILNRKDHVCKVINILNDRSKFQNIYINHIQNVKSSYPKGK